MDACVMITSMQRDEQSGAPCGGSSDCSLSSNVRLQIQTN